MFLFNGHEDGSADRNLTPTVGKASPIAQEKRSLYEALTGEERPCFIGGLLLVLVLLLHLWLGLWLFNPVDEASQTPAQAIMEVSLISAPVPSVAVAPPAPPKPEPPKKQPAKIPLKKKPPVAPKPAELPKPEPIAAEKPPAMPTAPVIAPPPPVSQPASPAVVNSEPKISTGVVPLERVPPKYPARAADRHIEGWVKIEFTITTSGTVEDAVVIGAEPVEIFDDAALKAINQWTFKEKIVNGVAVEQRAVQTLQFKLTR